MSDGKLKVTLVGGPTALLEIFGLRLLTDPTFDPAGGEYTTGPVTLRKLSGPALDLDAIGHIDTMTVHDAVETARAFPQAAIVPIHFEGWAHFSEGKEDIRRGFARAGLSTRLHLLEPGQSFTSSPAISPAS